MLLLRRQRLLLRKRLQRLLHRLNKCIRKQITGCRTTMVRQFLFALNALLTALLSANAVRIVRELASVCEPPENS